MFSGYEFAHRLTPLNTQQPAQHHKQHKQHAEQLERIPPPDRGIYVNHAAVVEDEKTNHYQQRCCNGKHASVNLQMASAGWAAEEPTPSGMEERSRKTKWNGTNWTGIHYGPIGDGSIYIACFHVDTDASHLPLDAARREADRVSINRVRAGWLQYRLRARKTESCLDQ